jgi:hypothetical protein
VRAPSGAGRRAAQHRARERGRVLARHHRHVVREDRLELDAARVVGRDDGRAAGERLQRDRGRRLQLGRQHEQVGGALEARDLRVRREAEEAHRAVQAEARGLRLERRLLLAGAGDQQARVGSLARHERHRVEERRLVGQRVEALHVEQQRSRPHVVARAYLGPLRGGERRELVRDRGIHDGGAGERYRERPRALEQRLAVERDVVRLAVHAPEARVLAVVVPDLGPVVRQHVGASVPVREPRRHLVHPGRGVHVDDVRAAHQRRRLPPGLGGLQGLRQPGRAEPPAPPHRRDALPLQAVVEGEHVDRVAARAQAASQQVGQDRVGRLVGRQVRRHHQHVHAAPRSSRYSRANSA